MALPRRFWMLVGWVIALSTLAAAAAVVEDTYEDLYALAGCNPPAPAPDYATCREFTFLAGAARVAGVVVKVPAAGLALVAAALWIGARRRSHAEADATSAATRSAAPEKAPATPNSKAAKAAGTGDDGGKAPARATRSRKRGSKGPSTALKDPATA